MCFANLYFSPLFISIGDFKGRGAVDSLDGKALECPMAEEWWRWSLCTRTGWRAELFTHMLAERCCWEPGRLTMAMECPGEAGVAWYMLTYTGRKDGHAESGSDKPGPQQSCYREAWCSWKPSRVQRYPSWTMSVVCGKSRAGIHRFMSWGGGLPRLHSKITQVRLRMKTSWIDSQHCQTPGSIPVGPSPSISSACISLSLWKPAPRIWYNS